MLKRVETVGLLGSGKTTLVDAVSSLLNDGDVITVREDLRDIESQRNTWRADGRGKSFFIQSVYYRHRYKQITEAVPHRGATLVLCDFSLLADHFVYSQCFRDSGTLMELEYLELASLMSLYDSCLPVLGGILYRKSLISQVVNRLHERNANDRAVPSGELLEAMSDLCDSLVRKASVPVLIVEEDLLVEEPKVQLVSKIKRFISEVAS